MNTFILRVKRNILNVWINKKTVYFDYANVFFKVTFLKHILEDLKKSNIISFRNRG